MDWFKVDREGLRKVLERRGKAFCVIELIQNAFDEDGVTNVIVSLEPLAKRPVARLFVEDDAPEGFQDLSHAWTLFAESYKKSNPEKRGVFDIGEKLVLAMCESAEIVTTTGGVRFDAEGRKRLRRRTDRGSYFEGIIKLSRTDCEEVAKIVRTLIPPEGITTIFNGVRLKPRKPIHEFEATLSTVRSDEEGNLKPTKRRTLVRVHEPRKGEEPHLYEMGIPVVPTHDRWHYDVCVAPNTNILTADLRYVRADQIVPGDLLVGFDEHCSGRGNRRYFRTSEVKHVRMLRRPCYRLSFEDGTRIICSADHQWLTRSSRIVRWLATEQMLVPRGKKPGSRVIKPLDRWAPDNSYEAGYLAAAFDGEGSLSQSERAAHHPGRVRSQLSFSQCENPMLSYVAGLLQERGFELCRTEVTHEEENWAKNVRLKISTRQQTLEFLSRYRPKRLLANLDLDFVGSIPCDRSVKLIKKKLLGEHKVIAIETSTRTYIAEGLASHNCQRIPINLERTNVSPAFLRHLRTLIVNEMHDKLDAEDVSATWVNEATSDPRCSKEAIKKTLDLEYGKKRVIFDPSDPEANKLAVSKGYTVIPGRSLSTGQWANVRKAEAAFPAGKVTPSSKGYSESGEQVEFVPREKWTDGMALIARYTEALAEQLMDVGLRVKFVNEIRLSFAACYASGGLSFSTELHFNIFRLGKRWFQLGIREAVDELLIHEFAHQYSSDHLSCKYHEALCRLGAKLKRLALDDPGFFKEFE